MTGEQDRAQGQEPHLSTDDIGSEMDGRLTSPSAGRNAGPILDALKPLLAGRSGLVLEVGSGTGQHVAGWAGLFSTLEWQPSDPFEQQLDSIRAWVAQSGYQNLRPPIWLDAAEDWPLLGPLEMVISLNVIHITPWVVTKGIVRGAANALSPGGLLVFYGPFKEDGAHTGGGNARFDASLRAQDPAWGIRDLGDVAALAADAGLSEPAVTMMPSNNRLVAFTKS
ncbi:MAG: DUF938 domain-containing protein [Pseudomonadota bacterium]